MAMQTTEWHHFEASEQPLGRLAGHIAHLLLGKHRADFASNTVAPVYVVVTNTDHVVLTGNKWSQKNYYQYSGYPGGMRRRTAQQQKELDSRRIVEAAIFGMLPKNSLRAERMKHLKLYAGPEHPHQAQLTTKVSVS
jgi:large subunit ribosomal protein L13